MALGDKKLFQLTQGGVSADVWLEDMGNGQTQVVITATKGTLDLNAIFWDLNATIAGTAADNNLAGAGIPSSLNMNGVGTPAGVAWDDAKLLSMPGSHDLQISSINGVNQSTSPILINAIWDAIDAFGIRAGGNKMADTTVDKIDPAPVHHVDINWDFEGYNVDALPTPPELAGKGWGIINDVLPTGGQRLAGSADMEVARDNLYGNDVPFTRVAGHTGEHQWLDSAGTPGPIHFAIKDSDLAVGQTATLKVGVAAELLKVGAAFMGATDQNVGIDFKYGNDVDGYQVKHVDMTDFELTPGVWDGQFDWNHFKEFTMDVHGTAGVDHLEVQGIAGANIGLAIDYISLKEHIV